MYWNRMNSFDQALEYIKHLGFGCPRKYRYPGWIVSTQYRLCNIESKLYTKAGKVYPYDVHFSRKKHLFFVRDTAGAIHVVKPE